MPTDNERRKVARRLRELPGDSTYPDLIGVIADRDGWYPAADAADRLADLIEPESERTCRVECYPPGYEDNLHYEVCSECGTILTASRPGDRHAARASYCPECGARVIGEETGDAD